MAVDQVAGWTGFPSRKLLVTAAAAAVLMFAGPVSAQMSARDGYSPDGSWRWQFELTPYLWLPASNASFSLGPRGGISGNASTAVPNAGELAQALHGAFMGYGLVRYGPLSGELDIDWVDASEGKTIGPDRFGNSAHLSESVSVVRVAPGVGLQVLNGAMAGVPSTLDVHAGAAWFHWSASISAEHDLTGGVNGGDSVAQPWLGLRALFYPAPRWRVELGGLAQGFGFNGGAWGWGASALVSYAVTEWLNVTGGFRALNTQRFSDSRFGFGDTRSLNLTTYGPLIGVGFRF
jgi:hypothetical protein